MLYQQMKILLFFVLNTCKVSKSVGIVVLFRGIMLHLRQLKKGEPINCPIYDYTVHNRSRNFQVIYPTNVIIVEGILIFENKELCKEMDIKIFVDTDADIRIIRRIQRDVIERARSLESVISQYMNTVKPMHEEFVEPSKKNADIIVLEGGMNLVAMDMIKNRIRQHLSAQTQV